MKLKLYFLGNLNNEEYLCVNKLSIKTNSTLLSDAGIFLISEDPICPNAPVITIFKICYCVTSGNLYQTSKSYFSTEAISKFSLQ